MVLAAMACERRELWIFQDNFKQVEVDVDWRYYDRDRQLFPHTPDPSGMTLWLFPRDGRASISYTTAEVRHFETYLSKGDYDALVIDYSPSEYGHQVFVDMDYAKTAKVQSAVSSYQPDSLSELFGPGCFARELPYMKSSGLYTVSSEPEKMASDTIFMHIDTGNYDEYIPYQERESYQSSLVHQSFEMQPVLVPWNMRVRIYIKGIYYLYQAKASIAGLADGYYLMRQQASDTPCLLDLDDWEIHVTGDNVGYIAKTFRTWGLLNQQNPYSTEISPGEVRLDRPVDELRLNLRCLLRDRRTVCYYHFDVGNLVRVYNNEYAMRIDLLEGFEGQPDLPYVEGVNGLDFGGVVVPWEDGTKVDVDF